MSYVVECPSCGHESDQVYRCEACGRDLATAEESQGRQEVGG